MKQQIATYSQARALSDILGRHGIHTNIETFDMKSSGIYIPRWLGYSRIPHKYDPNTGIAQWYFFLRFRKNYADINVGEAIQYMEAHGIPKLVHKIRHTSK